MLDKEDKERPDGETLRNAEFAAMISRAASDSARALVDKVHELVATTETRTRQRVARAAAFKRGLEGFLGDLMRAAGREVPWVYHGVSPRHFTGDGVTYRHFIALRRILGSLGLLEEVAAVQDRYEFGPGEVAWRGRATRFRATPKLVELAAACGVAAGEADNHFTRELPKRPLVLRGGSTRKPGRRKATGEVIKFDYTPDIRAMEQTIVSLNRFLDQFSIGSGVHRGYVRGFNLGDHPAFQWNLGGRLYSEGRDSYQHMPGPERLEMTMGGAPVCELDIRASYITIFHAQRGRPLDTARDPYDLPGLGEAGRDVVKSFIAMTFGNSGFPGRWSAERGSAFLKATGKKLGSTYPLPIVREAVAAAYPLLAELRQDKEKPPLWAELMFVESEAILGTMIALMDRGIPSLSVHDSLIVPQQHEATATELLRSIYGAVTTATPFIRCKLAGKGVIPLTPAE
jgi:hypothetical protein